MSIDVEIIPQSASPISWQVLRQRLLAYPLPEGARGLLGDQPQLTVAGTHGVVAEKELLVPTNVYGFQLAEDNTLGLDVQTNAETYADEQEFLEDFARNLEQARRDALAAQWQAVGFSYGAITHGGRNRNEGPIFVALAVIVAQLCDGQILIKDDAFSLPVGCYTPEEFRGAHTRF
jgi:hypothetical protein